MRILLILLAAILLVIIGKMVWVAVMTRHLGSFESERTDILKRRSYLLEKVVTDPRGLVDAMPPVFGEHYQGEWAIYSTSMLSAALVNSAILYPETREEAARQQKWIAEDVKDFAQRYPDVDLGKLDGNKAFRRFCGSRYGREPLGDLYEDYLEIAGNAAQAAVQKAESKAGRATGTGGGAGAETLTASQQKELDEWNRSYPQMKMTAKEFRSRE